MTVDSGVVVRSATLSISELSACAGRRFRLAKPVRRMKPAKFVRPRFIDSGILQVTGHVVSRGRTVITLEGRINAQGRLHAHGTSTCLVVSRKP
jgi:hypothetical protein